MEASGLGTWVRESPSIWAYPAILTLHSIGHGIVVGASVVIDLQLLGRARLLKMTDLTPLFPVIWWGFAVNFLTGALLFVADATRKSAQPVFYVKLACIAAALLIMRRTGTLIHEAAASDPQFGSDRNSRESGVDLNAPGHHKILAVASLVLWLGAITAGRLMAYL
jgi:hypothetical protein